MKKYFLIAVLFTVIVFLPKSASAQAPSPMTSSIDFLSRQIQYDSMTMNTMMTRSDDKQRTKSGGTKAPVKKVARETSTFTPSGSLIMPREFANEFGKTPQEKRDAEAAFAQGLGVVEDLKKQKGFAANDVARASSLLFINCLATYSGKDLTQKQKDGIYSTFKNLYETDEYFQSLSDKQRQRVYETNGILWMFVSTYFRLAEEKGDRESLQKSRDTAEYIFNQFIGVPITSIRLKPDGFEID